MIELDPLAALVEASSSMTAAGPGRSARKAPIQVLRPVAGTAPTTLSRGKVVERDLTMAADFTLAFDIQPTGTERGWASIVHYTNGGNGNRVPGIWFWPGTTKLHVVVGPRNHHINPDYSLPLNQWSSVRVQVAGATAKITVNGRDFGYTGLPARPATTVGVTLYAADPWYPAARASIRATSTQVDQAKICCLALTAECLACKADKTVEEFCKLAPKTTGCPRTDDPDCDSPTGSKSTELMLSKLKPAAQNFQSCHDDVDRIGGQLTELKDTVGDVREIATQMHSATKKINSILDKIVKKPPQGTGIADLLGKIPKVGIFIKMGLKTANKVVDPVEELAALFDKSTKKIESAIKVTEKVFVKTGKVTGPVAMLLTNGHAALEAAHGCASVQGYECGTAGGRMELANAAAFPYAKTPLEVISTTGTVCHRALNPIDTAMALIAAAARELSYLLDPVRDVIDAIEDFVSELEKALQDFVDALAGSDAAKCALEIFEPVSDVINLATCPIDEVQGAAFHFVVDKLMDKVTDLINRATSEVINRGVDAIVPDNLDITIPDFKKHLPSEVWLATCTAASLKFPEHAEVIRDLHAVELPARITGKELEEQIVVEAVARTQIATPARGKYESACVDAFKEMGSDMESCSRLVQQAHEEVCKSARQSHSDNERNVDNAQAELNRAGPALENEKRHFRSAVESLEGEKRHFNNANDALEREKRHFDNANGALEREKRHFDNAANHLRSKQRDLDNAKRNLENKKRGCKLVNCRCGGCKWYDAGCHGESAWCCPAKAIEETCKAGISVAQAAVDVAKGPVIAAEHTVKASKHSLDAAQGVVTAASQSVNLAQQAVNVAKESVSLAQQVVTTAQSSLDVAQDAVNAASATLAGYKSLSQGFLDEVANSCRYE